MVTSRDPGKSRPDPTVGYAAPGVQPAIGYARMSVRGEDDIRIEDQIERMQQWADGTDGRYVITEVFVDPGVTASREDVEREHFERMVAAIEAGRYRNVIAWHPTRITRHPVTGARFGEAMRRAKGKLFIVNGAVIDFATPEGQKAWHAAVGTSAAESIDKGDFLSKMHQRKREDLSYAGGRVSYGWDLEVTMVRQGGKITFKKEWKVVPAEADVLRDAARRIRDGEAVGHVCGLMAEAGVRTRTGKVFSITWLRRVLLHPRIAGFRTYGPADSRQILGMSVDWPPILTVQEWRETVSALDNAERRRTTGSRVKRVYAGAYRCPECATTMRYTRGSGGRKDRWVHPTVGARTRPCGLGAFSVPAVDTDTLMDELVDRYLASRVWETSDGDDGRDLEAERVKLEADIASVVPKVRSGEYDSDYGNELVRSCKISLADVEKKISERARRTLVLDADDARRRWSHGDLTERRRVLFIVLDTAIVHPGTDLPLRDRLEVRWKNRPSVPAYRKATDIVIRPEG
jgi:site-specific DNA recombinase